MNVAECFEQRLLRKIPIDKDKVLKSIISSNKFLKKADVLMKQKIYDFVIIATYSSMFHSARAILYRDGIQEKSHFAISIYLREKYFKELGPLIFELDVGREQRHEGIYGFDYEFSEEDCIHAIKYAREFHKKVLEIIKLKRT
ncbi:MAG: HEPN domain-containing protein [Candidatus Nanoarchaeia archaeon]